MEQSREQKMLLRKSQRRENIFTVLYVFTEKYLCRGGPVQLKPVLLKDPLYCHRGRCGGCPRVGDTLLVHIGEAVPSDLEVTREAWSWPAAGGLRVSRLRKQCRQRLGSGHKRLVCNCVYHAEPGLQSKLVLLCSH